MEIDSPHPTDARARASSSRSPALHRERRRAATAAAPPRRQQSSTSARRAPPYPTCSPPPAGHAPPAPPRRRPRRRLEHAGAERPGSVKAVQGHVCEKRTPPRGLSAKRPRPPL
jgi:hypothetical protein